MITLDIVFKQVNWHKYDIMRAKEFLTEDTNLTLSKVTKNPERAEKFLDLIKTGHAFKSTLGPIKLDPKQIPELSKYLSGEKKARGNQVPVTTIDGDTILMGNLYFDQVAWGQKGRTGDVSVELKPATVFGHKSPEKEIDLTPELAIQMGAFTASELGKRIQNNAHLKTQGIAGKTVIEMSKQISNGLVPTIPKGIAKPMISSIINDAFEYVGVQALIDNVAIFENREEFIKHLGGDLKSTKLFFPGKTNNPLADSYAVQNTKTGNEIYISSKGGRKGTGAASSIRTIIIPAHMLKRRKKDEAVEFISMLQTLPVVWQQSFEAAKFIKQRYPGALGELEKFVDLFDDEFYAWAGNVWNNQSRGVPSKLSQIPERYQDLYNLVLKYTAGDTKHALWYQLKNVVKDKFVGPAINSKKAIPTFSDRMLEILGHNFVLLKSKAVSGQIVTSVRWPYKMGGTVTFETKDSAEKWKSAMTWKLN